MADCATDGRIVPLAPYLLKQPAADEEKTWHAEKEQDIVKSQVLISQTKAKDMRINNENHR